MGTSNPACSNCDTLPAILASEPRRSACERVAQIFPDCVCESVSVTPLSPGVVDDAEILIRFVPRLDYDFDQQLVKPSLFAHAGGIGMSVTRAGIADCQQILDQQPSDGYIGYVTARCGAVRGLRRDGERLFAVYDTALRENVAHADVCQVVFRPRSKTSEIRHELRRLFSQILEYRASDR